MASLIFSLYISEIYWIDVYNQDRNLALHYNIRNVYIDTECSVLIYN